MICLKLISINKAAFSEERAVLFFYSPALLQRGFSVEVQPLFDYNGSNALGHLKNLLVQGGVEHEKDDLDILCMNNPLSKGSPKKLLDFLPEEL